MSAVEWILIGGFVALLWVVALYFFFVQRQDEPDAEMDDSVGDEIARWREASERTYARQSHIRRNR